MKNIDLCFREINDDKTKLRIIKIDMFDRCWMKNNKNKKFANLSNNEIETKIEFSDVLDINADIVLERSINPALKNIYVVVKIGDNYGRENLKSIINN